MASSASSHLSVTPTALKAAYATCTPPTQAKIAVTHAPGSVGIPLAIAVRAPKSAEAAMASQRAALPPMASDLIAWMMNGRITEEITARAA